MSDSVTKANVLERCSGLLCLSLYVVFTRRAPGVSMAQMRQVTPEHLAWQVEIEQRGILFAAGPLFTEDDQSWEGDGMIVIRAASIQHASEIAASDPMHREAVRVFNIRPWLLNEGGFNLKVTFSDGRQRIA
ncbi:MAG: hypothetical protein RL322_2766 [Pseudomonadota bacterium]|jgi:uncharacterized protein YciI